MLRGRVVQMTGDADPISCCLWAGHPSPIPAPGTAPLSNGDTYVGWDNALWPERARGAGVTCWDTWGSCACLRPACPPHPLGGFVRRGFSGEKLQDGWPPRTFDFFRERVNKGSADGEQTGAQGDSVQHLQLLRAFVLFFLVTFVITPLIVNVLFCICLKRNDPQ